MNNRQFRDDYLRLGIGAVHQAADIFGVSTRQIRRYLNGPNDVPEQAVRLMQALLEVERLQDEIAELRHRIEEMEGDHAVDRGDDDPEEPRVAQC